MNVFSCRVFYNLTLSLADDNNVVSIKLIYIKAVTTLLDFKMIKPKAVKRIIALSFNDFRKKVWMMPVVKGK